MANFLYTSIRIVVYKLVVARSICQTTQALNEQENIIGNNSYLRYVMVRGDPPEFVQILDKGQIFFADYISYKIHCSAHVFYTSSTRKLVFRSVNLTRISRFRRRNKTCKSAVHLTT